MSEREENEKLQEKNFIAALRSGNRTSVVSALKEIRGTGKVTILPEVFELLLDQEDEQIYRESVALINDLKNKEAVPYLMEALRNPDYQPARQVLAASCWQSGLNYSKHIRTFIDLAIQDTYATAIEAFTVIENSVGDLEPAALKTQIDYLRTKINSVDQEKQVLLRELIRVMETY